MGNKTSAFTEQELDDYQALTYLNKKQIKTLFTEFSALDPPAFIERKNAVIPFRFVKDLPQIRANPFKDRMMRVFCSSEDGMTFEDFLDMMSVFSDSAPKEVKVEYAFRIYDFDGDDLINTADLKDLVLRLTGYDSDLSEEMIQQLLDNILQESDLDNDNALSFAEFEHITSKAPDFCSSFTIRI